VHTLPSLPPPSPTAQVSLTCIGCLPVLAAEEFLHTVAQTSLLRRGDSAVSF